MQLTKKSIAHVFHPYGVGYERVCAGSKWMKFTVHTCANSKLAIQVVRTAKAEQWAIKDRGRQAQDRVAMSGTVTSLAEILALQISAKST